MKGQELIDTFLEQEQGRILLSNLPQTPEAQEQAVSNEEKQADSDIQETAGDEEEYFTETLARIYIRQGRYRKALDIIGRLNQQFPQKNAYFADQMRFLEKLIINNNKNKN
jgi:thioredoxin-like negative regulator of GroEL